MKKLFALITSVAIISAFSCKKDETNPESSTSTCKIHTVTEDPDSADKMVYTVEYNSNGKVSKLSCLMNGKTSYTTFVYTPTTATKTSYDDSNHVVSTMVVNLGSNGYASSDKNGTYEQDANGYLIKETRSDSSYTNVIVSTISNGNKIKEISTYTSGSTTFNDTTTFEYYLDKRNSTEPDGYSPYGKANKNLIKKVISGTGPNASITEYSYTFDGNGNATSAISTSSYGTKTQTSKTNYTYNCN